MKRVRRPVAVRWTVRIACLLTAAFLASGSPLPVWAARIVPALSPLTAVANAVAARTWLLSLFWTLPPLLMILAAVFRGRLFCRWVCPAGTLHSLAGLAARGTSTARGRRIPGRRWNGILFWTIIFSSATGLGVLLFLDPLATWNRFSVLWGGAYSAAALVPGLVLPVLLVLSAILPAVWCSHFCPLGYMLETLGALRQRPRKTVDRVRRDLIFGLAVGIPAALVWKRLRPLVTRTAKQTSAVPLLPPGAGNAERFTDLCTRCYACVNVCPTTMIRPATDLDRPVARLFIPVLDPERGFCDQFCNECGRVCPTGAIRALPVETKQNLQIGIARVIRHACLAWSDGEYCMVCQEVCPYQAIDTDWGPNNLARPVVNPGACRGCGFCQHECPAERAGKAIIVYPLPEQVPLMESSETTPPA